jgi:hypothetical protein
MEPTTPVNEQEYRCLIHDAINPCPFCERDAKIEVKDFMLEGDNTHGTDPKGQIGATKPQLALLPPVFNEETAKALQLGITKGYGPWNWRLTKVGMMTYLHAARRHLDEVIERIDIDPESGAHHLGHVAANCAIILDARKHGTLVDNRPPQP